MENKRNYSVSKTEKYITIPHSISRNSNLHFGARLLYGEILLLGRKHGYCWASNAYLSELLSVSEKTITRWIKALENEGFIYTDSKLTKDGTNRKLMIKAKGQECPLAEKPRDTGVQSQGTSVSKPRDIRVQSQGTLVSTIRIQDMKNINMKNISMTTMTKKKKSQVLKIPKQLFFFLKLTKHLKT